jgi:hypothetical protein
MVKCFSPIHMQIKPKIFYHEMKVIWINLEANIGINWIHMFLIYKTSIKIMDEWLSSYQQNYFCPLILIS